MSNRYSQIIILCEDRQHEVFIRHYLKKRHHITERQIRVMICPQGGGAGEQYVRREYPIQVKILRQKQHLSKALIAMIDADTQTVAERLNQLRPIPLDSEKIVRLVPKRNIETWIYYLNDNKQSTNETDIYPKLVKESACKPGVEKWVKICINGLPIDGLPSLQLGCTELHRLSDKVM
jgi:hypothetical protein